MIARGLPELFAFSPACRTPQAPVGERAAVEDSTVAMTWKGAPALLRTPDAGFETASPSPKGPVSNTGLNPHGLKYENTYGQHQLFALNLDYLTLVFSNDDAVRMGQTPRSIINFLFGPRAGLEVTTLQAKMWQFYRSSAYIRDAEGNVLGRIGMDGNGDTWCVSLSGAGCARVNNWRYVHTSAQALNAHISRIDIAFDDFQAEIFESIHKLDGLARAGHFAGEGSGRPPITNFFDDHGSNKGCTVYVGSKGRKQLCMYEKGKQLGDPDSPWLRVELRMWRSNGDIPLEAILRPDAFLRGAYELLSDRLPLVAEGTRPEVTKRQVSANAVAATRFLREQCGPLLNVMFNALGDDAVDFFRANVLRTTMPSRFRGVAATPESLLSIIREQLGYDVEPPPF